MSDKPEFPEREKDGCTWCGTVLSVYNNDGSLNTGASQAAQAHHADNMVSCPATPTRIPDKERTVDKGTGSLVGEYVNKVASSKGLSDSEKEALGEAIAEQVETQVAALFAIHDAPTPYVPPNG